MSYAPQSVFDALESGDKWGEPGSIGEPITLLFTFLTSVPSYYGSAGRPDFDNVTPDQDSAIRASLTYWSSVANITFIETQSADNAHLTFGQYAIPIQQGQTIAGEAFFPGEDPKSGDVWLNVNSPMMSSPLPGNEAFGVITHEIGHALGLQEPFGIGAASEDFFTVMSYTQSDPAGAFYSYKPMLWDIAVIQKLYGANLTTATGSDIYHWFDGSIGFQTIWDAGGTDKIDASATTVNNYIDLNPGAASRIGRADDIDNLNLAYLWNNGTTDYGWIENATGGSGKDVLIGNDVVNTLSGGGGNDTLSGGKGNDVLIGGDGVDTYVINTGDGSDQVIDTGNSALIRDGKPFVGVFLQNPGTSTYKFVSDNGVTIAINSPAVLDFGNGDTITFQDLTTAELVGGKLAGFTLIDAPVDPTTTRTILGDLAPKDFDPATAGVQTQLDDLLNVITEPTEPVSDRADTLNGSAGNDLIQPGGGDDSVIAKGGADRVQAGSGRDYVDAGDGNDVVEAGSGTDIVYGGRGNDRLYANANVELAAAIAAGSGQGSGVKGDWLSGGSGDDILVAGADNDVLAGGGGEDLLIAGAGNDYILGDSIYLAQSFEWTVTRVGNDYIFDPVIGESDPADGAADAIYAGSGNDFVDGRAGDDVIYGEAGDDEIVGGSGHDVLLGGSDNDVLFGDRDTDALLGDDFIDGGEGNDSLIGSGGNDLLYGGAGIDNLWGEAGDDHLEGETGADQLDGGAGNDTYVFNAGDGADVVYDESGVDTLVLGPGIRVADVRAQGYVAGQAQSVVITAGAAGDSITLNSGGLSAIETFAFGDGTVLSALELARALEGVILTGSAANDLVDGAGFYSVLQGGPGDDIVYGSAAATIYRFDLGDGADTVIDGGGLDTVAFGPGITANDISWDFDGEPGSVFTVYVGAQGDRIAIVDGEKGAVESFRFADGTQLAIADLIARQGGLPPPSAFAPGLIIELQGLTPFVYGSAGADFIFDADMGDITYIAGRGNDYLEIYAGVNYRYVMNEGDGNDVISADSAARETLVFGPGIVAESVRFTLAGQSYRWYDPFAVNPFPVRTDYGLEISYGSQGDSVFVIDGDGASRIETYQFADGRAFSYQQMVALTAPGPFTSFGEAGGTTLTEGDDVYVSYSSSAGAYPGALAENVSGLGGNDVIVTGGGNDTLDGGTGQDILRGGFGDDEVYADLSYTDFGNDLLDGGAGDDALDASLGNDLLIGGTGDDQMWGDVGNDVILHNRSDGHDRINSYYSAEAPVAQRPDTLSLGGGISYADLAMSRTGNAGETLDLVLHTGSEESVTLFLWYLDAPEDKAVSRLQIILSDADYDPASTDPLLNQRVQVFDFMELERQFDLAQSASTIGVPWNITAAARTAAYLGSSNTEAIGGDLAYVYAAKAEIDNLPLARLRTVLGDSELGGWQSFTPELLAEIADAVPTLAFDLGSGARTVANPALATTLQMGADITSQDLTIVRDGVDLLVRHSNGTDQLRIEGWYGIGNGQFLQMRFMDGGVVTPAALSELGLTLQAPAGGGTLEGLWNAPNTLSGQAGDDVLLGGYADDSLSGAAGNDTLDGGRGADIMNGGPGNDLYTVDDAADSVTEAGNEGIDTVATSITYALGANIENLNLAGAWVIDGTGNDLNNVLTGNSASNVLDGGAGADTMVGGAGNDTYVVDAAADVVTENPNEGTDTVQSAITYTLGADVENLTLIGLAAINGTGNALTNVLRGNAADNTLSGGGSGGADTLIGGAGNDDYAVYDTGDVVIENANEGMDAVWVWIWSPGTFTLSANVENLTLGSPNDFTGVGNAWNNVITVYGGSAANVLEGGGGNDWLDGGAGADTMNGGAGNDTFIVADAGDVVMENADEGVDLVQSAITYTLTASVENLTLTGTAAIVATGNALSNELQGNNADNTLSGGDGDDTLHGYGGADTLIGGAGNDAYAIYDTADVMVENADEGIDTAWVWIWSQGTYMLGANVENLTLGSSVAFDLTGNGLANVLTGNAANNVLSGAGGDDRLDGGAGADTLIGGAGNDTFIVDNAGDVAAENADEGADLVESSITHTLSANVENITLTGAAAIDATGNALGNVLQGNNADNMLSGGAGDDTLHGYAGADTLAGGAGNDIYAIYDSGDVVVEGANEGTDTAWLWIWSAGTFTLAANLENAVLGASVAFDAIGNSLDNLIIGSSADNALNGGGGNDTLAGRGGVDTLTGGAGVDTFDYDAVAEGADTITDFATGTGGDRLDLRDVLVGYTPGTSDISAFVSLSGTSSTTVALNADGVGTDFVAVTTLAGVANTAGLLDSMAAQGNLMLTY